jgi:hypothetical protein
LRANLLLFRHPTKLCDCFFAFVILHDHLRGNIQKETASSELAASVVKSTKRFIVSKKSSLQAGRHLADPVDDGLVVVMPFRTAYDPRPLLAEQVVETVEAVEDKGTCLWVVTEVEGEGLAVERMGSKAL